MVVSPTEWVAVLTVASPVLAGLAGFVATRATARATNRKSRADVASQIEEASGRLMLRQQGEMERQDREIGELRAQIARMRVTERVVLAYLTADRQWHDQVIDILASHGLSAPPAPVTPPTGM